jgi:hypothetical protein
MFTDSAFSRQHFLNFFPLPQGQGSLRPIIGIFAFVSGFSFCTVSVRLLVDLLKDL